LFVNDNVGRKLIPADTSVGPVADGVSVLLLPELSAHDEITPAVVTRVESYQAV